MAQKIRVFKLARDFGIENDDMVSKIQSLGIEVRNYMSALDADSVARVRRLVEKERAENTVEEHIRPTVVRRRSKEGVPAKPARKTKPPKVAEAARSLAEAPAATPPAAPKRAVTPIKKAAPGKVAAQAEVPSRPEPPPARVEPEVEAPVVEQEPALESELSAAATAPEPEALAPTPEPEPAPAPEETTPAATAPAETIEKAEKEVAEVPEVVEVETAAEQAAPAEAAPPVPEAAPVEPAPPSPEVAPAKPAAGKDKGAALKEVSAATKEKKKAVSGQKPAAAPQQDKVVTAKPAAAKEKKPAGVEVATGPAVLRPSTEAPVIRRRISTPPSGGRPSSRPSQKQSRVAAAKGSQPPAATAAPSAPAAAAAAAAANISVPITTPTPLPPTPSSGSPGGRRSRATQRRREVESREIAPQGRFTGVGPGKFHGGAPGRKRRMAPGKKGKKTEITTPKASKRVIRIEEHITLQELAKRMGVKATELLTQLMGMGVGTININSTLDIDTARIVASDFGYEVENVALAEEELLASTRADETEEEKLLREVRPPVITMMGHVDHGKTSLLDRIRKSDIVSGEAGGITQHIGAYRVKTNHGTIAFIDTPGHEAFTAMRSRGANVTDIVVLVTAADDGAMPQTVEAINHARAAETPIIVAINKCDLPGADPNRTRRTLMEHNLVPEELGGDTIMVEVSAKTGEGVEKLLEMIALQAEVMELSANPKRPASGVVLEAYLDRGRGPVANVLVQEGTLRVGEVLVAGSVFGKIRAMTDEKGRKLKEAGPSTPVEVLGLASVPGAGDPFDVAKDMKIAEKVYKTRADKSRASMAGMSKPSLEAFYEQMQALEQADLKLIVKTDVQGTMEALRDSLEKLGTEKVKVTVVHASVGGITESDVLLASTAGAIIVGFNVRPAGKARRVAEEQGVEIRLFSIIYEVIDSVKQAMVGMLEPEVKEELLGQVEVRDTFTIPKVGTIAGSYVSDGKIVRNARARLIRDSVQIWEGRLGSLRRFKDDVKEVTSGFECGISLDGYNDVKVGDVIEVFTEKEIQATL